MKIEKIKPFFRKFDENHFFSMTSKVTSGTFFSVSLLARAYGRCPCSYLKFFDPNPMSGS
jgi:hypothetical protein